MSSAESLPAARFTTLSGQHPVVSPDDRRPHRRRCFTTKLNPEAPCRIFAGNGPTIRSSAHIAALQREPFPVFLKRGNKQFEFVGIFRCTGIDETATALHQANLPSNRIDVTSILTLERVD